MDIERLTTETRDVTVTYAGQSATVSYYPNAYTLGFTRKLIEITQAQNVAGLAAVLEQLIADWDLTLKGEPIPTTADGIERVPLELLNAIQEAIGQNMTPSDTEKRGFSEPSSTLPSTSTAPVPSSPNGSDTSPSPTGSASPSPTSSAPASIGS